ncbi:MAG: hypothetical protein L0228_05715 [Planctomycetes bacterium]|nr:hypothetical protein [Planctomycetota bacterium]
MITFIRTATGSSLPFIYSALSVFCLASLSLSQTLAQEQVPPAADATGETAEETSYFDLRRSKDRLTRQLAERYFNLVKLQEWSSDKGTKVKAKYVSHDADLKSVTLLVVKGVGAERTEKEFAVPVMRLNKTGQSRVRQIDTIRKKLDELLTTANQVEDAEGLPGGDPGAPMLDERGVEPRTARGPEERFTPPTARNTREITRRAAEIAPDGSADEDPLGFGEGQTSPSLDVRGPAGVTTAVKDDQGGNQVPSVKEGAAAKGGSPAAVVRAFLEAQKKGDIAGGLAVLTEKARQKSGGQITDSEVGPSAKYRIEKATIDGDTARVPVKLTDNGLTMPALVRLRREAGVWRIYAMSLFADEGEEGMTLDFENPDQQMTFEFRGGELPGQRDAATTIPGEPGQFDRFEQFGKPRVGPGKVTLETLGTHGGFFGFAFSPDGETLAGGSGAIKEDVGGKSKFAGGGEVVLWNSRTGELTRTLGSHGAGVDWLAYSHDGRRLASASKDNGVIKIWDVEAGSAERTIEVPGGKIAAVAFSNDGKTVATVAEKSRPFGKSTIKEGGELAVWDAQSGAKKWSLPDSNGYQIAISPDGQTLAVYSSKVADAKLDEKGNATWKHVEPRFTLFDAASGKENGKFDLKAAMNVKFLAFLPETERLAVLGMQGLSQLDIRTGQLQNEIKWDKDRWAFSSAAVSADGKTVARAWTDWVERVDVASGQVEGVRKVQFPTMLFNVVFAPDLKRIACSQHGAVIIDIAKLDPSG